MVSCFTLMSPINAYAELTDRDVSSILNDSTFYDDNPCSGGSGASLVGNDNMQKAYNFFLSKQVKPIHAAGIVGNLMWESGGMNPGIVEGGAGSGITPNVGFGIAQWTTPTRQQGLINYAAKSGLPPGDLSVQLNYLWESLNGNIPSDNQKASLTALQNTTTVEEATKTFMDEFERPNAALAHLTERIEYARSALAISGGATTGETINTEQQCGIQGSGTGQFTTNTSINFPGVEKAMNRAKELANLGSPLFNRVCTNNPLGAVNCYALCEYLSANVWSYRSSGYESAKMHWLAAASNGQGHAGDRNPPVGALLFYSSTGSFSEYGHVAVYLGNNLVLSNMVYDGRADKGAANMKGGAYIANASEMENDSWGMAYLGWAEPVFVGQRGD